MKTFARQLPRNFKPDSFVRAGHERDALRLHDEISLRNAGTQERRSGLVSVEDSPGRASSGRYKRSPALKLSRCQR
jgi:hypothetical protein